MSTPRFNLPSRDNPLHIQQDESVVQGNHIPDRAWLAQHLNTTPIQNTTANPMNIDKVVTSSLLEHHAVVIHHLLHLCRHTDPTLDVIYQIRAENRYVKWLFLLERLRGSGDESLVANGTIVPPIDVALMWLVHLTAVRHYVEDISRLFDDALLYVSPPLERIRQLLELANDRGRGPYFEAHSARMWTSFTGEDWTLKFTDTSPFFISCPTCTCTITVSTTEYLRLKLEPRFDQIVCAPCGTVLTSSFLSAVRFVNDFKGALREPNIYVAGTLLNPVTGKPNHYLSKQIIQYLSQAPSVANLYASVIVPVPTPPHSPGMRLSVISAQPNAPTDPSQLSDSPPCPDTCTPPIAPAHGHPENPHAPNRSPPNSRRSSFLFRSQTNGHRTPQQLLDPWCEIANILFQLEVDLYALELEDHRLISWHIRAAIDRMERGYRNLVTPLSIDLVLRVRSHWRTTAALLVAWMAYAGAKDTDESPLPYPGSEVHSDSDSDENAPVCAPPTTRAVPASDFAQMNHHPADAVMVMLPPGMLGIRGGSTAQPSAPPPPKPSSILGAGAKKPKKTLRSNNPLLTLQPTYNLSVMVTPGPIPVSPTTSASPPQSPGLTRSPFSNPFYESRTSMVSALPSPIALEVSSVTSSDVPSAKYKLSRGKLNISTSGSKHRRNMSSSSSRTSPISPYPSTGVPAHEAQPAADGDEDDAPIPKLLSIVDPQVLQQITVRYHQFILLQQGHSGLYSARLALPLDLVLANWTHLLHPPRYIRFSNAQFGRLITYEFSTVQTLDAALRNTARKWRRRYKLYLDLGYRPKLSFSDKVAAVVDRVMGRLVSVTPM